MAKKSTRKKKKSSQGARKASGKNGKKAAGATGSRRAGGPAGKRRGQAKKGAAGADGHADAPRSPADGPNGAGPGRATARSRSPAPSPGVTAETLASRQKEISVSEFFAKNRHLLGFDSPSRALLTTVKEAVDNSLDACEEAEILPEIEVIMRPAGEDRFRVVVSDNGPGIVKGQIPRIFAKLLYGSKFHSRKQSRGQQGIGISAAGMYGTLTTGKPIVVTSRSSARRPANRIHLATDTARNIPVIHKEETVEVEWKHGTCIEIELEATYKKGKHSVDAYLEQVALANPHARIVYRPPGSADSIVLERVTEKLPEPPREILPHPHGVELGVLMRMLKETASRNLRGFLSSEFSRVTASVADRILEATAVNGRALVATTNPRRVNNSAAGRLHAAIAATKLMAPPTNCLSPIGQELIETTLKHNLDPDLIVSVSRPPAVYRGNPFQVEVGLAYGGGLPGDELSSLYRFANRVPLQYQQSACAITKAVLSVPWRNYEVQQSRGALPSGPIAIMAHIASVWVPFTSESKKAVAHYDEILKEMRLALMDVGRRLAAFLRRRRRQLDAERKHAYIEKYIPQIGIALQELLELSDRKRQRAEATLTEVLEKSRKL